MRIAVMGAGAVGCYYGAVLARAGHAVMLIGRQRHVDAVQAHGLMLESAGFSGAVPVQASVSAAAVADADLVLFSVKSSDTEHAGAAIAPHLAPQAAVLSLQNGVDNAQRLGAVLNRAVTPAVVYVAVAMAGAGQVRHHGRGELLIGTGDASESIAAMLKAAGIPTEISSNVAAAQWEKLIINCAFNALSAIPQRCYGDLVRQPGVIELIGAVIAECLAVARAASITVRPDLRDAALKIGDSMATQYSSTAQDLAAGRRSEIDHLNGYVVRQGAALGVATPLNHQLQTLVKLIETAPPRH